MKYNRNIARHLTEALRELRVAPDATSVPTAKPGKSISAITQADSTPEAELDLTADAKALRARIKTGNWTLALVTRAGAMYVLEARDGTLITVPDEPKHLRGTVLKLEATEGPR